MSLKNSACMLLFLFATPSVTPWADSTPLGSATQSTNATINGNPLLPETVVFNDQVIQVSDGAALIALNDGSRIVFGKQTTATLHQDLGEISVLLNEGNLSIYHSNSGGTLRVKAEDVSVVPELGFRTFWQIAILDGSVVVSSKSGMLRVEGRGSPFEVPPGRTITIQQRIARSPQVAAAGGSKVRLSTVATWAGLGTGVLGTIVGFDALHRADDARTSASNAATAAAAAAEAAAAASRAAAAATQAAASAASLATAAATLGLDAANIVGCDLNRLANSLGQPSPYTPPGGLKCP